METYYERSLRSKYRSQWVQTSFYESTPSPTNSLGDKISTGSKRSFGHAGTNHPYAPKERDNGSASRLNRVLLEHIPGKKGFRRVASSHRSKESERTHSRSSFPYVHDKHCSKLRRKRRLRVQDRSAGCVLSCTDSSKQQEVPQVRLRKQGVPVSSTTFRSKYSPQLFTHLGHTVTAYLHRQGVSVIPYLDDWLVHHPDRQILLRHQIAQIVKTLDHDHQPDLKSVNTSKIKSDLCERAAAAPTVPLKEVYRTYINSTDAPDKRQ